MNRFDGRLVVVLGMHRSGTSAITRGLSALGVPLGSNLMPPVPNDNDKGYFEDLEINDLNIELLTTLNRDWHSLSRIPPESLQSETLEPLKSRAIELLRTKIGDQAFGFKNPRLARLLPFWQAVFKELDIVPSYVIAIRNPKGVAQSLQKRAGFDFEKSYYLWLEHVLPAILETAGAPRVVVDFDSLMDDPSSQLQRIAKTLGLPFDPHSPSVLEYVSEFLDPSLRHAQFDLEDLSEDRAAAPDVIRAYRMLVRLNGDENKVQLPPIEEEFEAIDTRLNAMSPALEYMARSDRRIGDLVQVVAEREARLVERDSQLDHCNRVLTEQTEQISRLNLGVAERDGKINELDQALTTLGTRIADLERVTAARNIRIANLSQEIFKRDGQISDLNRSLDERVAQVDALNQSVREILDSTSWRLSAPVRFVGRQLRPIKVAIRALPYAISASGGYRALLRNIWERYKDEGIDGITRRIVFSASVQDGAPIPPKKPDDNNDYSEWVRRYDTISDADREKIRARIDQMAAMPLISIVMPVYNPPLAMLEQAIRSVERQLYPNWELCIADDASTDESVLRLLRKRVEEDPRIKVVFRNRNGHISAASNSAIDLANGEYIAFLDNDDLLAEHALFWVAETIAEHPDVALIYSDEDKIDQSGERSGPYFKSDWNPDLLLSHNMICHLGVYRADVIRQVGRLREGYEGAQDHDLALRCSELLKPEQIVHIPRVLYHWRSHPGSTAQGAAEKPYALRAGQRALNDHFSRLGISARAEILDFEMYRVRYDLSQPAPLVSLIVPTRNGLDLVRQCVNSILQKTTYPNYEVLIVDNGSDEPKILEYFTSVAADPRIRVLRDEHPFNFSALNNFAVAHARGQYLALINNDIEVISPQWLEEMVSLAQQPGVGAVGARLWYPNDTLQHGGVIVGIGGIAGHSHKHLAKGEYGYFGRAQLIQTISAVTAACLVVQKSIYEGVGGLDEANLKVAFNDVDFCLRLKAAGFRNVWTPYAELYHHESATRGHDDTPEKKLRFENEVRYMKQRWGEALQNDPAYSPNLTLEREDFSFAWPPRVEFP